jgi:hypothetical protein
MSKKKKNSQWKDYQTYTLSDGTKFLAQNDSDAELYRQKVGDGKVGNK